MAPALWREAPLHEGLRLVCEGLHWLGRGDTGAVRASKSAISQAHTRVGSQAMRQLAQRILRPLVALGAPGARYQGLPVVPPNGSCVAVAAEVDPHIRSEQAMAAQMLPVTFKPDTLVLADCNFFSFKLWQTACATGAKLVRWAKADRPVPVDQVLLDGSYLSRVYDGTDKR